MSTAAYVAFAVLWIVVVLQAIVLLGVTRSLHALSERGVAPEADGDETAPGLKGDALPAFSRPALNEDLIVDNRFISGRTTALLFVSPDCSTCSVTLDELEALEQKTQGSVVVFCRSTEERCRQLVATYRLHVPVVLDEDYQLSRLFHVVATPTAVLVDPKGIVTSYGAPMSGSDLEESIRARAEAAESASSIDRLEVQMAGGNRESTPQPDAGIR